MIIFINRIALIPLLCLLFGAAFADSETEKLLAEGKSLREHYQLEKALEKYETVLKAEPKNVAALVNKSWLLSKMGETLEDGKNDEKKKKFERAKNYAQKAMKLDRKSAEAHYTYAIALGLLTELESNFLVKAKNGKKIRKLGQKVVKLDEEHAGGHYMLGKWNQEMASLPWHKRATASLLIGQASLKNSEKHLKKATELEPENILYHYDLAVTYNALGKKDEAKAALKEALALKGKCPDDKDRLKRCKNLLAGLD